MAEGGIRPPKPIVITTDAKENWEEWLQSYEWYAAAVQLNKKENAIQVATFMAVIGREAQQVFKTFGLNAEEQQNLAVIKRKFAEYFTPKVNYTFERYKFNQIRQKQSESFKDFLTRLKIQASRCNLGIMEEELVRDRIVVGVESNDVREKLLSDAELNLNKAVQVCFASESASQQLKNMVEDSKALPIISTIRNNVAQVNNATASKNKPKFAKNLINDCRNCGNTHKINECPAFGKNCKICQRKNHFAKKCRSKDKKKYKIHEITEEEESFIISSIDVNKADWYENVIINNKIIPMKLDTGAQCDAIPFNLAKDLKIAVKPSTIKKLLSYSDHTMDVAGESLVTCKIKDKEMQLRVIIPYGGCPVLGRKTCSEAGLIKRMDQVNTLQEEFHDLFEGIGCIKGFEYTAEFSEECIQREIKPPRRVPFSIRPLVRQELDRMVQDGIIKKVEAPTPISSHMVIVKQKGKIRICIDPSDLNKILLRRHFPLKTLEEVTANVTGSKYFTKLDLKKGFWQLKVSPSTQPYLTFSTPWGRYCFQRVPFGIKTAPEIFQSVITHILQGIEGVDNSMDDILIYATDLPSLQARTKLVLQALRNAGAKLNKDKCEFEVQKIKYLGHILTSDGIRIDPEKVETIDRIKTPTNKKELQRLLGMVQYLHKFIPNLSEKTHNMRLLLRKNTTWHWGVELDKDLDEIKKLLKEAPELTYYDPNKALTISVDASSFALGAVLLQEERPIAYSSVTMNEAQKLYPQIEKEALAMRHGCKKFHQYIYGNRVIIETDHKPLESIFNKTFDKTPPRLRKIFLEVQQYSPKVVYKRGTDMHISDLLSRDCHGKEVYQESTLQVLSMIPTTVTALRILQNLSSTDAELLLLKHFISAGWPKNKDSVPDLCKKYLPFVDELSVQNDLILKGLKIIIPEKYRCKALENLHKGHLGISSCLRRARECMYWPGMSTDIITMIENCTACQKTQRASPVEPLINKEIPKFPWEIVASDIFSFQGTDYLIITDSYSGFFDFKPLKDMTSRTIIELLKDWFSVHGIPRILETDNGPNYASREFKEFAQEWMFTHQTSSPKYPKGNGLAERAVQTAELLLKKCRLSGQDIKMAMLNFRNTPRDNLGSPAQRLYSRRMRTTVPIAEELLKPEVMRDTTENLRQARLKQKFYHDKHARTSDKMFHPNQNVMLKQSHRSWIPAKITSQVAPRSYKVITSEGEYRRNTSQLQSTKLKYQIERKRRVIGPEEQSNNELATDKPVIPERDKRIPERDRRTPERDRNIPERDRRKTESDFSDTVPFITRSGRTVKPPKRLDL